MLSVFFVPRIESKTTQEEEKRIRRKFVSHLTLWLWETRVITRTYPSSFWLVSFDRRSINTLKYCYYCFHILMLLFFFLLLCLLLCLRRRRNVSPSERNSFNALLLLLCCVYNNKIKKRTTTTTTITKLSSSLSTPLKNVHSTRKTNSYFKREKMRNFYIREREEVRVKIKKYYHAFNIKKSHQQNVSVHGV